MGLPKTRQQYGRTRKEVPSWVPVYAVFQLLVLCTDGRKGVTSRQKIKITSGYKQKRGKNTKRHKQRRGRTRVKTKSFFFFFPFDFFFLRCGQPPFIGRQKQQQSESKCSKQNKQKKACGMRMGTVLGTARPKHI